LGKIADECNLIITGGKIPIEYSIFLKTIERVSISDFVLTVAFSDFQ
jgi:hypothetical protein